MKKGLNILVVSIIALSFNSCISENISPRSLNSVMFLKGTLQPSNTVALGKIKASTYNSKSIFLFDEGQIDSSGYFELTIPPPPESYLQSKLFDGVPVHGSTTRWYSDTTAQYGRILEFRVVSKDSHVTFASNCGDINADGTLNRLIFFIYCTKNVSYVGRDSFYSPTIWYTSEIFDYQLSLNEGWNKIVYNYLPIGDSSRHINVYVDNSIIGSWFHQSYY